jgi:hypothetical protein
MPRASTGRFVVQCMAQRASPAGRRSGPPARDGGSRGTTIRCHRESRHERASHGDYDPTREGAAGHDRLRRGRHQEVDRLPALKLRRESGEPCYTGPPPGAECRNSTIWQFQPHCCFPCEGAVADGRRGISISASRYSEELTLQRSRGPCGVLAEPVGAVRERRRISGFQRPGALTS